MKTIDTYITEKLHLTKDNISKQNQLSTKLKSLQTELYNYLTGTLHYDFNKDWEYESVVDDKITINFIPKINSEYDFTLIGDNLEYKLQRELGNDMLIRVKTDWKNSIEKKIYLHFTNIKK